MKPLRELKRDSRLKIIGPNKWILAYGYHAYDGVISCEQFKGSVVFGLIKDMFFYPDEDAIQYHPKAKNYFHGFDTTKHCLHLWRPMKGDWKILNNPERWG